MKTPDKERREQQEYKKRIEMAIEAAIITSVGQSHHLMWTLDQMVRCLTGRYTDSKEYNPINGILSKSEFYENFILCARKGKKYPKIPCSGELAGRINKALSIALRYGSVKDVFVPLYDNDNKRKNERRKKLVILLAGLQWVIDQMIRALLGCKPVKKQGKNALGERCKFTEFAASTNYKNLMKKRCSEIFEGSVVIDWETGRVPPKSHLRKTYRWQTGIAP